MLGADVAQPASLFALASGGEESAVWCLACVRVRRCGRSRGLARMRVASRIGGRIPAGTACVASSVAANLGGVWTYVPCMRCRLLRTAPCAGRPLACCAWIFAGLCLCQQSAVLARREACALGSVHVIFERCVALEKLTCQGASRCHAALGQAGNAGNSAFERSPKASVLPERHSLLFFLRRHPVCAAISYIFLRIDWHSGRPLRMIKIA